jgi:hypothetical protein
MPASAVHWRSADVAEHGMSGLDILVNNAAARASVSTEEIAYPILWLASDETSFTTGIALPDASGFEHRLPE